MNQDNQEKIVCPRCSNEMNKNSRCCLHCGWLNPNDPANQNVQKIMSKNTDEVYQVGSLQTIAQTNGQVITSIASKTGNRSFCFIVNFLIYIIIIGLSFIMILKDNVIDLVTIKNSLFPYILFVTSIVFIYFYSMQLIFTKANKKWWYALVPFYNLFVFSEIVYKKKWLGILLLIPVVGQIFFIVTLYKLAGKFKYSGLLTIIFPIIYIPLMGFGSKLYEDVNYISDDTTLEKDYKRKRAFFVLLIFFLLFGGAFIFWNNIIEIKSHAFRLQNYYYVIATKQIVDKTEELVKDNFIECKSVYKEDSGRYYIEYADFGDVAYIPFHAYRDIIEGYVIIDNTSGSSKYYVSLSDGTYGFSETLSDDVTVDTVVPYEQVVKRKDINKCVNTKPSVDSIGGVK